MILSDSITGQERTHKDTQRRLEGQTVGDVKTHIHSTYITRKVSHTTRAEVTADVTLSKAGPQKEKASQTVHTEGAD